jgi:DNA-binding NtrC family response regulator
MACARAIVPLPGALHVLVVDDEPDVLRLVAEALREDGHRPVTAQSDAEAYRILDLEGENLDAVIVDVNLGPGTTGFDVARYARRTDPYMPVVYITGHGKAAVGRFGVYGARVLEKPFNGEQIVAVLETLVAEGGGNGR